MKTHSGKQPTIKCSYKADAKKVTVTITNTTKQEIECVLRGGKNASPFNTDIRPGGSAKISNDRPVEKSDELGAPSNYYQVICSNAWMRDPGLRQQSDHFKIGPVEAKAKGRGYGGTSRKGNRGTYGPIYGHRFSAHRNYSAVDSPVTFFRHYDRPHD